MDQQNSNGIKAWQWIVTAVVIIVLIIIGIIVFSNKGSEIAVTPVPQQNTNSTANTSNGIVMADQYPGDVAYVSSVQLANAGFVVIQKNNAGTPGDVIGSTFVEAGISPAKVNLTQPMIDGSMYYAVLYSDNGDKKFDANTDKPLTDANGNIIMKIFKATASANNNVKG